MVRNNKQRNTPNFLITPPPPSFLHPKNNNEDFDECDVVWSDNTNDIVSHTTTTSITASPRKYTAGISAAVLGDDQPRSPTSVQRKTASSPVAMISSSYLLGRSRGGGPGGEFHMSAPVNVPIWPNSRPKYGGWGEEEDDVEVDEDEEMVPPHEIVARSRKATAFSVIEGAGRTLKGRDMTRVRNAVFQKTGFID